MELNRVSQILMAVTSGAFSICIGGRPAVGLDNEAKNNVNWRLIYWRDTPWLTTKCPSSHTLTPSISLSSYLFSTWLEISLSFCKFLDQYLSNYALARNSKLSSDKRGQERENRCVVLGKRAWILTLIVSPASDIQVSFLIICVYMARSCQTVGLDTVLLKRFCVTVIFFLCYFTFNKYWYS
jgi:hypothetical protein